MIPRDSPNVLAIGVAEDLIGIPSILLDLNRELADSEICLSSRVEADVSLLSAILRVSCEHEVVLNPKSHFFVLMLMAITRHTEEHLVTCGDLSVVLPRHPRAHLETLSDWLPKSCTPAAISMVVLGAPKVRWSSPATPRSPSSNSPSADETHNSTTEKAKNEEDNMDVDLEDEDETDASPNTEEDPDLDPGIMQLHLLTRPSASTPFCIPAVCLAPLDTIFDVMASALQQRRAWGLADKPMLGLAFHPRSTRLHTFWGWFESSQTSEDLCVPIPRIAFSATSVCVPAPPVLSSYDLADNTSALGLARLLHSMRSHFHSIRIAGDEALCAGIAQRDPPIWRSDTRMVRTDTLITHDRIASWLEKIDVLEVNGVAYPSPSSPSSPSSCSSPLPMAREKRKASKEPTVASDTQGSDANKNSLPVPTKKTGSQGSSGLLQVPPFNPVGPLSVAGTRRSASTFSHPTAVNGSHRIYFWALSRTVLTHTFTGPPTELDANVKPWGKAEQDYYDLTQPNFALTGRVAEAFAERREKFYSLSAVDERRLQGLFENTENKNDVQESVADRCVLALAPAIFFAVELARGFSVTAEYVGNAGVPETTWRTVWDFLTAVVLIQLDILREGDGAYNVLDMLEQTVRLPQADGYIQQLSDPEGYSDNTSHELSKEARKANVLKSKSQRIMQDSSETQRLTIVHAQAKLMTQFHQTAFSAWRGKPRLNTDHLEAPLHSKTNGLWALAIDNFFDGAILSYRQESPGFLPLDIAERKSRFQGSHAPSSLKSVIHRSAPFMNCSQSSKDGDEFQRVHYMADTMIGGSLGMASPGQPISKQRTDRSAVWRQMLRAEAKGRKKIPRVPLERSLFVPFFIREYKRLLEHPKDSGVVQCRMALAAVTKFLGALSITLSPVYGLVTEGPIGNVHMAVGVAGNKAYNLTDIEYRTQLSNDDGKELSVHVFERGCNGFNLKTEQGAVAYVAFLVRLYTTVAPALSGRLRAAKTSMADCLQRGEKEQFSWSMEQNPDVIKYEEERDKKRVEEKRAGRGASESTDWQEVEDDTLPDGYDLDEPV